MGREIRFALALGKHHCRLPGGKVSFIHPSYPLSHGGGWISMKEHYFRVAYYETLNSKLHLALALALVSPSSVCVSTVS